MILAVLEGLILSFVLLLVCVVNIKDGPVGGVHYYEEPVKKRVIEMGLITEEEIKRNRKLSGLVFMSALLILAPLMALLINHANGFADIFVRLIVMYMVALMVSVMDSHSLIFL